MEYKKYEGNGHQFLCKRSAGVVERGDQGGWEEEGVMNFDTCTASEQKRDAMEGMQPGRLCHRSDSGKKWSCGESMVYFFFKN